MNNSLTIEKKKDIDRQAAGKVVRKINGVDELGKGLDCLKKESSENFILP